eukprot:Em0008g1247a
MDDERIPDPPVKPLPGDCCGSGCTPCVLDVYQKELALWQSLCNMTPQERAHWRRTESQKSPKCVECVYKYTFELLPDESIGLGAGQHAMLRVWEKEGVAITRPYTPISPLAQLGSFEVLIKVYEDGRLTQRLKEWDVGTTADWRGAIGHLHLHTQHVRRVGMLGCGTGIAPLVQLARSIVDNENDITFVHMLYCCRTQHDILMKEELDRLASFWNFTVLYALSASSKEELAQDPGLVKYGDRVHFGRIGQMEVASS